MDLWPAAGEDCASIYVTRAAPGSTLDEYLSGHHPMPKQLHLHFVPPQVSTRTPKWTFETNKIEGIQEV